MSPRSLLFSSNEETSRQIGQALLELDLTVDSCREIFAALEKLTTRRYEVVVVDCNDGAEAAFLLKTAHELKRNKPAFIVVLENPGIPSNDLCEGAHVLRGPFISDQIKYSLLTCDAFLAVMRNWFFNEEPEIQGTVNVGAINTEYQDVNAPSPHVTVSGPLAGNAVEMSSIPTQPSILQEAGAFDPLEDVDASLPSHSDIQSLFATANAEAQSSTSSGPLIPVLLCIGLGAALLFTDYVFDEHPLMGRVITVSSSIARNLEAKAEALVRGSARNRREVAGEVLPETRQLKGRKRPQSRNDVSVHVTEIRANDARTSLSIEQPSQNAIESSSQAPSANGMELSTRPSPLFTPAFVSASLSVPESLNVGSRPPIPEHELQADVPSRLTNALLPVNLTGEFADKLLLEKTQPSYPERALQAGLQGSVVLQALIGTDGLIRDLKLLSGPMLLGKAASEAVKQWRYKPYLLNGHAVEAQTLVTVDFKLP